MFTGIVQGVCRVVSVEQKTNLVAFLVDLGGELSEGLKTGASVSVDGVCLSVTQINGHCAAFDAIRETLDRTTLAALEPGRQVNIERSASAADEVGGHRVSGHIHGTAFISDARQRENERILALDAPPEWMNYIFPKGFIALDGASLTVVEVDRKDSVFTVHLIPETLRKTTFASKRKGQRVNLEIDAQTQAIVDTVERIMMERYGSASDR
jgi:riboflavin synthase